MDLMGLLWGAYSNPWVYSGIFFVYVVLAAVILPIPVELGLFNPTIHPIILITILAVGKGVGSLFVFEVGTKARKKMKQWSSKFPYGKKFIGYCEDFVMEWGYYGLLIILSIPLMVDSVSLYLFSLLNPQKDGERGIERYWFVVINVIAGAIRGIITLSIFYYVGIKLA